MPATITHGVRAFLGGKLTKGWRFAKQLNALRNALASEVSARRGKVTVYDTALIESAARHEGCAQLWTKHLREHVESLTIEQKLAVCREVRSATDARDKCLEKLGLNKYEAGDVIDIYAQALEATEEAEHVA